VRRLPRSSGASLSRMHTITGECVDIRGGGEIAGGPTVVTIASPTSFTRAGETYR